ncbi:MAG: thioredoxin domain-containing protein [Propionibacteriaceae bacterium]|nr:thioredoxin domain-containing protein [Propionibacteriaceae bacterium]
MSKPTPAKSDSRRAQLRAAQIEQAKRAKNKRIAILAVVGVVVIALVAAGALLFNRFSNEREARLSDSTPPNATAERNGIVAHPGRAAEGAPLVEVFSDYQCPACAQFEAAYGGTLDEMAEAGEIQLVMRTMTFLDRQPNGDSTRAANAAACADLTGHYAAYNKAVFDHQIAGAPGGLSDEVLTQTLTNQAGITGAGLDQFNTCFANTQFDDFVDNANNQAGRDGVTGTPTIRVNGTELDRNQLTPDPNSVRTMVEQMG